MIRLIPALSLFLIPILLFLSDGIIAAQPYSGPGIRSMELLSASHAIVPGEDLHLGLLIAPEPEHHTYWKGPGIVGVATSITWDLPEGFEAGPLRWPAPEKVDMVGITANGYRGTTLLLSTIKVPDSLPEGVYHLKAKVAWMACATSCNPGVTDFTLTLPCAPAKFPEPGNSSILKLFQSTEQSIPSSAPAFWKSIVTLTDKNTITLRLSIPGMNQKLAEDIEFFCDDMQVNSDKPTKMTWINDETGTFQLQFSRPDFAPKDPPRFSGVIRNLMGWPSTESLTYEISIPWPEGTFSNE
ncbi:MAG: protein-disulfide reductase DsbD family protein [Verrucomicrobiales bacterium]|nr:protein-disulfide reductase DsbD family protein [Verrucomicrobiales bacterium]